MSTFNIEVSQVLLGINATLDEVINDNLRAETEQIREMEREAHKDADRVIGGQSTDEKGDVK